MSTKKELPKILVVVGPTASGKTGLGIQLAKKFNGEVVSADSRQIYKEFNIGVAKPKGKWMIKSGKNTFISEGIPHYLVDFVDPKEEFVITDYKKLGLEAIYDILDRGKLPILVGGSALYIHAIDQNLLIPNVPPNQAIRARYEKKPTEKLYKKLLRKDPEAAEITGTNKRRIIRALEVIKATGKKFSTQRKKGPQLFNVLKLAPKIEKDTLQKQIRARTNEMIKDGLVEEVKVLAKKYSWKLPVMQSINYCEFKDYIEGRENLESAVEKANRSNKNFARRQMTWFRRDKEIKWVKNLKEAEKLVGDFITN